MIRYEFYFWAVLVLYTMAIAYGPNPTEPEHEQIKTEELLSTNQVYE